MRYYLTQRPVMLGAFPRPAENRIVKIGDFDQMRYCPEIGRNAWGYIDYTYPLSREEAEQYELTEVQHDKSDKSD